MELGYSSVIPTFVLLDATLTPLERLTFGVLSASVNKDGVCHASNLDIAVCLRYKTDGVTKQLSPESIDKMLASLEEHGYIHVTSEDDMRAIVLVYQKTEVQVKLKKINKPTSQAHQDVAKEVLKYLSDACITRGYRKVAYKETPTNLEPINARLAEGNTFELCIAVINTKFEDPYFKENKKYLSPQTLFRPANFERYISESSSIKDVEQKVVTKTGLSYPQTTTTSKSKVEATF